MLETQGKWKWVAVGLLGLLWIAFLSRPKDVLLSHRSTLMRSALEILDMTASPSTESVPVQLTLVYAAGQTGAVCLDGSLPGYHLDEGSGDGENRWIIHLQGGAWCADGVSCAERSQTSLGSSHYMNSSLFEGILNSSPLENPYFYNWNRVKVRYCDGGSFSGNVDSPMPGRVPGTNQSRLLYYRGQRIWQAVIKDLLAKGMNHAVQALLSGESAGGLASFIHCNQFKDMLPVDTDVKCLSDGGFFLDIADVRGDYLSRTYFKNVVTLQNISNNLPEGCTAERDPGQCFFPQYFLKDIDVPMFILESAYDTWQIRNFLVPRSSDPNGIWTLCKEDPTKCSKGELNIFQDFRRSMLVALSPMEAYNNWGLFLISCFYHTQTQNNYLWNRANPPRVRNTTAMEAIGDWVNQRTHAKIVDCAYSCNPTCTP